MVEWYHNAGGTHAGQEANRRISLGCIVIQNPQHPWQESLGLWAVFNP